MEEPKSDSLLAGLRAVGLSRYEANVYLGLIRDQTARVAEISRRTGVPQPKVYQALESLTEKGFCSLGADEVNRYRPLPPEDVLEGFALRKQEEAEKARRLAVELEALRREGQGQSLWAPPVEIVKGLRHAQRVLSEQLVHVVEEIGLLGKLPLEPSLEVVLALREAVGRGARMRVVSEPGYLDPSGEPSEAVRTLLALPFERRQVSLLPTKLVLLDRRLALTSVPRPGEGEDIVLLAVRNPGLVEHFLTSFEAIWARARAS